MTRAAVKLLASVLLIGTMGAHAQTMKSDHWSTADLRERAKHLQEQAAKGDGSASETLEKYPHHYTMLAFRQASGGGELHQSFADVFFIIDGHATVVTGGTLVNQNTTAPERSAANLSKADPHRKSALATLSTFPPACPTKCAWHRATPSPTSS